MTTVQVNSIFLPLVHLRLNWRDSIYSLSFEIFLFPGASNQLLDNSRWIFSI